MAPRVGDFGQRTHDKPALGRPRMGEDKAWFVETCAAAGDQIEIKGSVDPSGSLAVTRTVRPMRCMWGKTP